MIWRCMILTFVFSFSGFNNRRGGGPMGGGGGQNMRGRNNFNGKLHSSLSLLMSFLQQLQIVAGQALAEVTITTTTTLEGTTATKAVRTWEAVATTSTVSFSLSNVYKSAIKSSADRGGGNRGRYGNFNDDQNRDEGFSGGRQNYGQQNRDGNGYGNREERGFNNYGGNRGSHSRGGGGNGGGAGGSNFEPRERQTSESMSQLSLEGKISTWIDVAFRC